MSFSDDQATASHAVAAEFETPVQPEEQEQEEDEDYCVSQRTPPPKRRHTNAKFTGPHEIGEKLS